MKYVNQNTGNGFFEVKKENEEKLDNARVHIKELLWLYRDDLKHGDISHLELTLEMLDLFELYKKYLETSNRLGIPTDTWDEFINKNHTHFKIPMVSMSHEYDSYVYRCERTDRKPIMLDNFIANYEELIIIFEFFIILCHLKLNNLLFYLQKILLLLVFYHL